MALNLCEGQKRESGAETLFLVSGYRLSSQACHVANCQR